MGFQHDFQRQHKLDGLSKAIHSPRTPAHLKPHLRAKLKEHSMAQSPKAGFNPKTAAKPEMQSGIGKKGPGSSQAESQVKAAPAPFKNPKGIAKLKVPKGPGFKPKVGKSAFFGE